MNGVVIISNGQTQIITVSEIIEMARLFHEGCANNINPKTVDTEDFDGTVTAVYTELYQSIRENMEVETLWATIAAVGVQEVIRHYGGKCNIIQEMK